MRLTRNPLAYLAIIVAWCWIFNWPTALAVAGILPMEPSPLFAAVGGLGLLPLTFLFAYLEGGPRAVGRFLRRTFIVPTDLQVWGLALLPALLIVVGIVTGGLLIAGERFAFAPSLQLVLINTLILAWVEEVVWRGFITPRLLERFTPAQASLRLGLIWMLWHMPFFWLPEYSAWGPLGFLAWAPFYVGYTYALTWMYIRSGGSVLLTTVSHLAVNWVITWMEPFWLENAGSIFAAVALVPILWRWFPRRAE